MLRVIALSLLVCGAAFGAEAPALPQFDFEKGAQGWDALGGVGTLRIAPAPEGSRLGKSALEHRFRVEKGKLPLLGLALPNGLAGMRSLRLDLATGTQTLVAVALIEKGGARYEYLTATSDQAWMHLEIGVNELRLADDTKDANDQLDLADAQMLVVADLRSVLTAMGLPLVAVFGERAGEQGLWIDNVVISAEPLEMKAEAGVTLSDDFQRENMPWVPIGGASVALDKAPGGGEGRALRMEYTAKAGTITSLFRNVTPGSLAGTKRFTVRVASKSDVMLALGVEETGGARYGALLTVKGGEAPQTLTAPLAAFQLAPGGKDDNGQIDFDRVKALSLLDLACFTGQGGGKPNTIWVQSIAASATER